MGDAAELRKLAEWYRAFSAVGRTDEREGRLRLAEYLTRRPTNWSSVQPVPLTYDRVASVSSCYVGGHAVTKAALTTSDARR